MNQTMQCPKCPGVMRTYNRNGMHIEQCDNCHGIYLDHGELEALSQLASAWAQPPAAQPSAAPPPMHPAPSWGAPQYGHYGRHRHKSFASMLFSS